MTSKKRVHRISASFSDFAEITVDGLPESLLKAFWKKMSELKEIETLVAELKIAANFRGVNNTFPPQYDG